MPVCSICQREFKDEFDNNAEPVNSGRCCNHCDNFIVIPARIRMMARADRIEREQAKAPEADPEGFASATFTARPDSRDDRNGNDVPEN